MRTAGVAEGSGTFPFVAAVEGEKRALRYGTIVAVSDCFTCAFVNDEVLGQSAKSMKVESLLETVSREGAWEKSMGLRDKASIAGRANDVWVWARNPSVSDSTAAV